jgi:hypothetical protein
MLSKEYLLNNSVAINCNSESSAIRLFKILEQYDFSWETGHMLNETKWKHYGKDTLYFFDKVRGQNFLTYDRIRNIEKINQMDKTEYKIVDFSIHRVKKLVKEILNG